MKKILALSATLALSGTALAGAVYGPGAGAAIPDNAPAGVTSVINVPDSYTVTDVNVTINGLTHTWVGDIVATLTKGAVTRTFVSRIGRTSPTTGVGDSSDFNGSYTFDSDSANSIFAAAAAVGGAVAVAPGTYFTSDSATAGAAPNQAGNVNNLAFNAFDGLDAAGDWTLTISDNASGDLGNFTGWTIEIAPEPTSLSLLGLAGLALIRRR